MRMRMSMYTRACVCARAHAHTHTYAFDLRRARANITRSPSSLAGTLESSRVRFQYDGCYTGGSSR